MNEEMDDFFTRYAPKSREYSTIMNMTTIILLSISFHICGYEDIFTELYSCLGM